MASHISGNLVTGMWSANRGGVNQHRVVLCDTQRRFKPALVSIDDSVGTNWQGFAYLPIALIGAENPSNFLIITYPYIPPNARMLWLRPPNIRTQNAWVDSILTTEKYTCWNFRRLFVSMALVFCCIWNGRHLPLPMHMGSVHSLLKFYMANLRNSTQEADVTFSYDILKCQSVKKNFIRVIS